MTEAARQCDAGHTHAPKNWLASFGLHMKSMSPGGHVGYRSLSRSPAPGREIRIQSLLLSALIEYIGSCCEYADHAVPSHRN